METYKYFLIIPPGLEDLARAEVMAKMPLETMEVVKGGIEVEASLDWMEEAHLRLKIPTRILMRITEFKVRDFPKLYQKFLNFSWTKVLSHPEPEWEITCAKSRINHTGRIEETIKKALGVCLTRQPLSLDWQKKNYPPQTFYIRIVDDNLTMSLDLSGEPLFKRGLQVLKGEAPLRENFAAAFAMEIFEGVEEPVTLVDPMCGSATLLTEALTFHQPLHLRPFAFETCPFYKGRLVKKCRALTPFPIEATFGFDLNGDLLKKVQQELKLPIKLTEKDSLGSALGLPENSIMICNPPYGERIKIAGKRGEFLREAWTKFLSVDKPFRFGWVLPSDMDDLFSSAKGYKLLSKRHLKNGGLSVTYWIWERK